MLPAPKYDPPKSTNQGNIIQEIYSSLNPDVSVWIASDEELAALGFTQVAPARWCFQFGSKNEVLYFHKKEEYECEMPQWSLGDWGKEVKITCVSDIVFLTKIFGI